MERVRETFIVKELCLLRRERIERDLKPQGLTGGSDRLVHTDHSCISCLTLAQQTRINRYCTID